MATSVEREYKTIVLSGSHGTQEEVEMVDGNTTDEYMSSVSYSLSQAIAPATLTNWDRVNVRLVRYSAPNDFMTISHGKNFLAVIWLNFAGHWYAVNSTPDYIEVDPEWGTPTAIYDTALGQEIYAGTYGATTWTSATNMISLNTTDGKLRFLVAHVNSGKGMIILPDGPHSTTARNVSDTADIDFSSYRSSFASQIGMDYNTAWEVKDGDSQAVLPYPVSFYPYTAAGVRSDLCCASPSGTLDGEASETGIIGMVPVGTWYGSSNSYDNVTAMEQPMTQFEAGTENFVPVLDSHDLQNFTIDMVDQFGGPYFYNNGPWVIELEFEFEKDSTTSSSGSGKYKRLDDYIFRT